MVMIHRHLFRKHDCCLYVADSLSFVQVDVDLSNAAGVFLSELDVYVLAVHRPPIIPLLKMRTYFPF